MKSVYWLRTDLRILDNEALTSCLKANQEVVFVFAETKSLKRAGPIRKKFVHDCLTSLQSQLEEQGYTVLETEFTFIDFLPTLQKNHPFDSLYFTQEYAWEEKQEQGRVQVYCQAHNIGIHSFEQGTLIAQGDLPFTLEKMPFVFTDFRKKIEFQLKIKPLVLPPFSAQENPGLARLNHYLWKSHAVQTYKETRNGMIHLDDSSKLSPWLNLGVLSPRSVYYELKKYEPEVCENESTYWLFFELLWRDYFKFFSLKFGPKIFLAKGLGQGVSPNQKDLATFHSWCEGKTQDSFINANMNELNLTGWMSRIGRINAT